MATADTSFTYNPLRTLKEEFIEIAFDLEAKSMYTFNEI